MAKTHIERLQVRNANGRVTGYDLAYLQTEAKMQAKKAGRKLVGWHLLAFDFEPGVRLVVDLKDAPNIYVAL